MNSLPKLYQCQPTEVGEKLDDVQRQIVACTRCPRLREYCAEVARVRRRAFRDEEYWGKPVPSFGDPAARLLIVGLAPAAHGGNRTGRAFTGDRSGDFLYRALYQTGFANQPESRAKTDGLELTGAWISQTNHCAPPKNKPAPEEVRNCRGWMVQELELLAGIRVVVALGRIAFAGYLGALRASGRQPLITEKSFGHNRACEPGPTFPTLLGSYHPSQQNTSTGRLTESMLRDVFETARRYCYPA